MELFIRKYRSCLMGFSILWIIAFHFCYYGNLLPNKICGFLFADGFVGVDIFMFLSAYGLCYSYRNNSIKHYYLNRIKRIYPMYLLFLVIAIAFFHKHYSDSPAAIALFQSTGLASFRMVDFEWYIPALIVVYAVFPLLYIGIKWCYDKAKWSLPVILTMVVFLVPVISKVVFPMFAYRIPIILIGIITFFAVEKDDSKYLLLIYLICAFLATFADVGKNLFLSLTVPLVLKCLSELIDRMPFEKYLSFVGKHSLELYLAQCFALNHYFLNSEAPFIKKSVIAFVMIVTLSTLFCLFQKGFYKIIGGLVRK